MANKIEVKEITLLLWPEIGSVCEKFKCVQVFFSKINRESELRIKRL